MLRVLPGVALRPTAPAGEYGAGKRTRGWVRWLGTTRPESSVGPAVGAES
jgi:hypothetical protein